MTGAQAVGATIAAFVAAGWLWGVVRGIQGLTGG